MEDPGIVASGARSIAARQVDIAVTGDGAQVDARKVVLGGGAIPHPASVAPPPGLHNLPRAPARVFVGRAEALERLARALDGPSDAAVVTQPIYGLGGVGKSELALQHARARLDRYVLAWWIVAADRGQLQAGLAALAERLCPPVALASTTEEAAAWATGWLQAHDGWLLVLDNVTDPADAAELTSQLAGGHIVITSRRDAGWEDLAADPVRLGVLDPGPATDLLIARAGRQAGASRADAAAVAAELGFLPLALDQAAAYMTQARVQLAAYLDRLRRHPDAMHAADTPAAQQAIARTWDITIAAIRARDPRATWLLELLACYAPDDIPRAIVAARPDEEQLAADQALGLLASYSMITLTATTVSMHRLVQAAVLAAAVPDNDGERAATAAEWLSQAIPDDPDNNVTGWPLLRALLPHADSLAARFPPGAAPARLGQIQNELGIFLSAQGEHQRSLVMRRSALAIVEASHGPRDQRTAAALANLAVSYTALGRYADALPLEQRALRITRKALGARHPSMAIRLDNLAQTYGDLGRRKDALPLQKRALRITQKALGDGHPDTALRLSNLALTYVALGRYGDALPLQERALRITRAARGDGHLHTADDKAALALIYSALGRHADALPLEQEALDVSETILGPSHPGTAVRLFNLGTTYWSLGRRDEALSLMERALDISERALGPGHPKTIQTAQDLIVAYTALGRPADARQVRDRIPGAST